MAEQLVPRTASAYAYPLTIRQLFEAPLADVPEQVIVSALRRKHLGGGAGA